MFQPAKTVTGQRLQVLLRNAGCAHSLRGFGSLKGQQQQGPLIAASGGLAQIKAGKPSACMGAAFVQTECLLCQLHVIYTETPTLHASEADS